MRTTIRWMTMAVLFLSLGAANTLRASEFGRNGFSGNPSTNGGATCAVCHAAGAPRPTVTLSGPALVDAGSTAEYTVTVNGGPARSAGVNVSVSNFDGTLMPIDGDLDRLGNDLTHTVPKNFSGNEVTFSFQWTAPDRNADVTLYAAGNSTNDQFDLLGDGIGLATLSVNVRNGPLLPPPPPPFPPDPPADISMEAYVSGLSSPVVITHAGDDRLFVVERAGRIRVVTGNGNLVGAPFLDIRNRVDDSNAEMGLLGLAFHPDYVSNGYFFVYYTRDPGAGNDRSRISRFQVSTNQNVADAGSELVLMEFEQPFANHNAGDLHFGPDGYLYIASGDGGAGWGPDNEAQDNALLLGKLLRIDVDTVPGSNNGPDCEISASAAYSVPPGNAYSDGVGGAGCDEIYASGLRHPWRFSFDRETGDLWIADVGQNEREEINFVSSGTGGGLDFGWRCYEGNASYNLNGCSGSYLFPVHEFEHTDGNCSITGGFVYRGLDYPSLTGQYFFADFCGGWIRTLSEPAGARQVDQVLPGGGVSGPSTFGEDADGELYVASLHAGIVYRIHAAASNRPPVVQAPGDQASLAGDSVSLRLAASDPDGDPVAYSASGLPPALSINASTGLVSGTLSAADVGSFNVSVAVNDGNGGRDSVDFSWTVTVPPQPGEIIVDNLDPNTSRNGSWSNSSGAQPWAGNSFFNDGGGTFNWIPNVVTAGRYIVSARWTYHANRSDAVPYRVNHLAGVSQVVVNQRDATLAAQWVELGTFDFAAGSAGYVQVSSENGQASADAIRLVRVDAPAPQAIIVDNLGPNTTRSGSWTNSSGADPWAGNSVYNNSNGTFRWAPEVATAGYYTVSARWTYHPNRSTSVPYRVSHAAGLTEMVVNQNDAALAAQWVDLGTFEFLVGSAGYVEVSSENGQASADAIRLLPAGAPPPPVQEIIVDNLDLNTTRSGTWLNSSGAEPWAGNSVFNDGGRTFSWIPDIATAGRYAVSARWTYHANRSDQVPYRVAHSAGVTEVVVNQQDRTLAGQWIDLGTFEFSAGSAGYVQVSSENGQASADAIRLVPR